MRTRTRPRSVHARRAVLILAACLFAGSAALFVASALLQLSPDAALRHLGSDLRAAMPYPLLGGALFALLYFVIQKAANGSVNEGPKSMAFAESTTMQELPDEREAPGPRPPPG
jgi:hypothetical protein